jgi:hypothetical protein
MWTSCNAPTQESAIAVRAGNQRLTQVTVRFRTKVPLVSLLETFLADIVFFEKKLAVDFSASLLA